MPDKPKAPKPTPASENLSSGHGSIGDIQDVAQDAAEGHAPPVKPQPAGQVDVGAPKKD